MPQIHYLYDDDGVGCGKGRDTTLSAEALLPPLITLPSSPRQTVLCRESLRYTLTMPILA